MRKVLKKGKRGKQYLKSWSKYWTATITPMVRFYENNR